MLSDVQIQYFNKYKTKAIGIKNIPDDILTHEFCETIIEMDPYAIKYMPTKLVNLELCMLAATLKPSLIRDMPTKFKSDIRKLLQHNIAEYEFENDEEISYKEMMEEYIPGIEKAPATGGGSLYDQYEYIREHMD